MKRLLRPVGVVLAAVLAAAAIGAVPPAAISATAMLSATAAGDSFGPGPITLSTAVHEPAKAGRSSSAANLGGRLVFRAGTTATGQELWITDGTPAGTRLLADIWPGKQGAFPEEFVTFGARVFFTANDGAHGAELWATDGTAGGTQLVVDLVPGDGMGAPHQLTVAGGTLYFAATSPSLGEELWTSDGTAAGTRLVADLGGGPASSRPRGLTAFNDKVVFGATVDVANSVTKPFVSDGTTAGTVRLDPLPPTANVVPLEFVPIGDRLLFSVYTPDSDVDLWTSRGAAGDATLVKDIYPGGDDGVAQPARLGNRLVLAARTADAGSELWTSDGTAGGTQLLRDINPGAASSVPIDYQVLGGRVWFSADDGEHGQELWSSDGTTGGTALFRDAVPGPGSSFPLALGVVGGRALWTVETPQTGAEPWVLEPDGTFAPLGDVSPGATGSDPIPLGALGNTWVFASTDPAVPGVYAANLQPSVALAKPKRTYTAKQARAKRVVVKVVVAPAVTGGTVAILRKGRVVGRANVVNGVAKVRIRKRLKPGRHRFSAVYRGSVWAQASAPDRFRVRVLKARS